MTIFPFELCQEGHIPIRTILSVDPGTTGAWSFFDSVTMMCAVGKLRYLDGILDETDLPKCDLGMVFIEQVHSNPKFGVKSCFVFGSSFGQLRYFAKLRTSRTILIPSQRWKKEMGLIKEPKTASVSLARNYGLPSPINNHNIAESFLLGLYGIGQLQKGVYL
jgi:hypothetical protein